MLPTSQIINFMKTVEKLCLVKRDILMSDGRPETDADHILKLCYLVMMVSPYLKSPVDYTKMLELALVHDLVEAKAGDIPLAYQNANPDSKKLKKQKELEAIEHFKTLLPEPLNERIYDLFMEYENRETREAKIVWALDKTEANLQSNQHHDGDIRYWADEEGGEWYYERATTANPQIAAIGEDILLELEQATIELTRNNIEKCGIIPPQKQSAE